MGGLSKPTDPSLTIGLNEAAQFKEKAPDSPALTMRRGYQLAHRLGAERLSNPHNAG
jgi:hypothetical protein